MSNKLLVTPLALIAMLALIIACGPAAPAGTPAAPATPVTTPEPADTPAPIDTPEPADTPQPADTPEPADTPAPGDTPEPVDPPATGELERLFPATIGGQEMEYVSMQPGMMPPGMDFGDEEFGDVLDELNASPEDISILVGIGEPGMITAMQIRGQSPQALQDAFLGQQAGMPTQTTLAGRTVWTSPTGQDTPAAWMLFSGDLVITMIMSEEHATEVVQGLP